MVERMLTPGEGPGVVVQPIVVESRDEIGRLAEAFNTVNDVTVQVAQEQAALRASIAEMFVNVARRNQVLLGRQLSQLDKMEAREEDPDVLDSLFKLDHLATRMRRNAESLLVLAGIDSTRRLRSTLPLSDVIRTAVGEIEAFDRIDLSMSEDPEVSGRHALTVAHLLAELLENATHFSNPDTRVVVSASVSGHGVDVTVTDYGLGMSEAELGDANDKIAHPPVAEIAVSQRLGLFVVGRLAARLGATVELRRGRAAGTVVAVALPTTVFEGMVAPEPVEPRRGRGRVGDSGRDVAASPPDVEDSPDAPVPAKPARRGLLAPRPRSRRRRPPSPSRPRRPSRSRSSSPEPAAAVEVTPEPDDVVAAAELPFADPEPTHEPAEQLAEVPEIALAQPTEKRGRRGLLGRRRAPAAAPAPVEETDDDADADLLAFDTDPDPEPEPVPEVVEVVEPTPEPEPEPEPALAELVPSPSRSRSPPSPSDSPPPSTSSPAAPRGPAGSAGTARPRRPDPVAPPPPRPPRWRRCRCRSLRRFRPRRHLFPSRLSSTSCSRRPRAPRSSRSRPGPGPGPGPSPGPGSRGARGTAAAGRTARSPDRPDAPPGAGARSGGRCPRPPRRPPPDLDHMASQAQMHSSALSELRGLYEPSFTPAVAPPAPTEVPAGGLIRRTPKAVTETAGPAAPAAPARSRSAAEVRGMLSGYRAGVERGRDSASDGPAADATTDSPTS